MSVLTEEVSAWSTFGYVIIAAVMILLHFNVSYKIFDLGTWFPLRTTAEYDRVVLKNRELEAKCAKLEKFMPVLCQRLDPTGVLVRQFEAAMELQDPVSDDPPTEKGQKGKGLLTRVPTAFNGLKSFFVDVKNFFERNKSPSADGNSNEPDPGPHGPQESPSQDSVSNGSGSAGPVPNDLGSDEPSPQEPTTSATGNKEPDTAESGVNEAGPKKPVSEASVTKVLDSEEPAPEV